jgi:hypothetical protein
LLPGIRTGQDVFQDEWRDRLHVEDQRIGHARGDAAAMELFAEDCVVVMESDMDTGRGKKACFGMLTRGALAFDRSLPLEIVSDAATPTWGVFEFINQGAVAPGVVDFAACSTWKFPADPSTLVGHKYRAPVCMVYQIDANGHISSLHEYTDVASLMKSIK